MRSTIVFVLLALLAISGLFSEAQVQPFSAKIVRIEIDGKEVKRDFKVFFLSNGKWIEAERISTGFAIPSELTNKEYLTVLITFEKYKLEFPEIHISKFNQNWIVGIDNKPFSDEFVKPEEAKITKRAYYIQFEGNGIGSQLVITEKKNIKMH